MAPGLIYCQGRHRGIAGWFYTKLTSAFPDSSVTSAGRDFVDVDVYPAGGAWRTSSLRASRSAYYHRLRSVGRAIESSHSVSLLSLSAQGNPPVRFWTADVDNARFRSIVLLVGRKCNHAYSIASVLIVQLGHGPGMTSKVLFENASSSRSTVAGVRCRFARKVQKGGEACPS